MGSGKHTEKGYHYKCLICGNEDTIMESSLNNRKCGCNVCCTPSQKILIGYNDMWTTNPELAKLLADPNDGYKYMQGVTKYTNWVCPDCGNIIEHKRISTINKYGLSCSKCSDGKHKDYYRKINNSYYYDFRCPECMKEKDSSIIQKNVENYLNNLGFTVLHETNCTIIPINPKTKYPLPFDNEIELINKKRLICEVNGIQHYELNGFHKLQAKRNKTTPEYEL